jgi:hypothetical protein
MTTARSNGDFDRRLFSLKCHIDNPLESIETNFSAHTLRAQAEPVGGLPRRDSVFSDGNEAANLLLLPSSRQGSNHHTFQRLPVAPRGWQGVLQPQA